jgi:hypothetical protein
MSNEEEQQRRHAEFMRRRRRADDPTMPIKWLDFIINCALVLAPIVVIVWLLARQ